MFEFQPYRNYRYLLSNKRVTIVTKNPAAFGVVTTGGKAHIPKGARFSVAKIAIFSISAHNFRV